MPWLHDMHILARSYRPCNMFVSGANQTYISRNHGSSHCHMVYRPKISYMFGEFNVRMLIMRTVSRINMLLGVLVFPNEQCEARRAPLSV